MKQEDTELVPAFHVQNHTVLFRLVNTNLWRATVLEGARYFHRYDCDVVCAKPDGLNALEVYVRYRRVKGYDE